jgi:hypothetical protein
VQELLTAECAEHAEKDKFGSVISARSAVRGFLTVKASGVWFVL